MALLAGGLIIGLALGHTAEAALDDEVASISGAGSEVTHEERTFRIESASAAADIEALLPEIAARTEPGDSIFVGNADLTRTVYSDTFLYYLVPDLVPASFYTELNPGTANGEDSTLATELENADVLLLTSRYEPDTEAAAEAGSSAAQCVVDERFCMVKQAGTYELLMPCDERDDRNSGTALSG